MNEAIINDSLYFRGIILKSRIDNIKIPKAPKKSEIVPSNKFKKVESFSSSPQNNELDFLKKNCKTPLNKLNICLDQKRERKTKNQKRSLPIFLFLLYINKEKAILPVIIVCKTPPNTIKNSS